MKTKRKPHTSLRWLSYPKGEGLPSAQTGGLEQARDTQTIHRASVPLYYLLLFTGQLGT
jgi:hypothetical protein